MPSDWLRLTTHRLDIYNESLAKVEFLEKFEKIIEKSSEVLADELSDGLKELPTAFDYIRLGHPLSCLLEWAIAKTKEIDAESVISFSSETMPILAVLRKNLLENKEYELHDKLNSLIRFHSKEGGYGMSCYSIPYILYEENIIDKELYNTYKEDFYYTKITKKEQYYYLKSNNILFNKYYKEVKPRDKLKYNI